MSSSPLLRAHPFPLIRGGGLFLLLIGLSIVIGAVAPRRLWEWFIAGGITAAVVVMLTAIHLAAPLGKPTTFQLESLITAVPIEVIALGWLGSRPGTLPESLGEWFGRAKSLLPNDGQLHPRR